MSATGEKAVDQAQNFSGGVIAAARRRDRWGRLEANATDDETREQYREAIADLSSRFPDLEDVPIGGAEAFARERGHGSSSRSPIHEGRRRKAAPAKSAKPASRPKPAAAGPKVKGDFPKPTPGLGPAARRGPSQAAGAPTPRLDRAIRRTGIPAAVDSGGSAVLAGVGMTVGLSLAFLLFSSAEKPGSGTAALPSLVNGVTKGIGRFISLGDVFPSNAGAARVQAAPISRNQARRQGRSLLGEVPQLPPAHHLKKSKGYKFPPQYVTKGGG
jgi:hypothetical protein